MEVHNAIILFKRSTQWGFKYTTYISDGDSKVYNKLKEENIYDVPLEKMECSNHMAKRASNDLHKFGLKWQPSATAHLQPPLPPSNSAPQRHHCHL